METNKAIFKIPSNPTRKQLDVLSYQISDVCVEAINSDAPESQLLAEKLIKLLQTIDQYILQNF